MAAYEVLLLNTAVPQIQAAQSGDTYVVPRDIAFSTVASFAAGTAAAPSIVATGDVNTGIWFPAADTIAASTGGTERVRLDASGNLGLGVTPSAWRSTTKALQSTAGAIYDFSTTGKGITQNAFLKEAPDAWAYVNNGYAAQLDIGSGQFAFYTAPSGTAGNTISFTQAMTLDASGNLVVGGTSANVGVWNKAITLNTATGNLAYELTVAGAAKGFLAADASNVYLQSSGAIPLIFTTNGSERARITSGGDLLVGTTSASTQITFVGGSGITYQRSTDNSFPGVFDYLKSRGSVASPTAVQNGDGLFLMRVAPYHGSAYTYLNSMTVDVDGTFTSGQNPPTRIAWYTNAANGSSTERARITSVGNFKIGGTADRATTEGTNQLVLFNGTAPVGTLTNGVSFYSESGEARVMDAAGNATLLSPHDTETNEWIFHSKHTPSGKVLRIDVERLLRFVNDHFGLDAVKEFVEE